jgi:hypothetical protein
MLVQQEAQSKLALLEEEIRRRIGSVRVMAGRTAGLTFTMFTYRAFSGDDEGIDPVVAGITLARAGDGVQLDADICGEHTGDVIVSLPKVVVPFSKQHIVEAVRDLAGKVAKSADAVVAALQDSSRRPE